MSVYKTSGPADWIEMPAAVIVAEGSEGNIRWTLDEDFSLTISGKGPMPDWFCYESMPWSKWRCVPLAVTITHGITSIGAKAFSKSSLSEISIPNSVTKIGESAFRGCDLSEISIPDSITEIGENAFADCSVLTRITLPNSLVHRPGRGIFEGCVSLKEVTMPAKFKEWLIPSYSPGADYYGAASFKSYYGIPKRIVTFT